MGNYFRECRHLLLEHRELENFNLVLSFQAERLNVIEVLLYCLNYLNSWVESYVVIVFETEKKLRPCFTFV